jgi:hypothetical protein
MLHQYHRVYKLKVGGDGSCKHYVPYVLNNTTACVEAAALQPCPQRQPLQGAKPSRQQK